MENLIHEYLRQRSDLQTQITISIVSTKADFDRLELMHNSLDKMDRVIENLISNINKQDNECK